MPGEPGDERNKTELIPSPTGNEIGHHEVQPALPMPINVARLQEEPVATTELTERLRAAVESLA